ncbi:hypothetical protein ACPPVT_15210 [Angustibacter sp. McL0619]|uniref:hypothetical protein n=1 Tax=Angustibacter sp. McL0619 TaxID=3415676 RepID=UPI003CF4F8BE
MTRRSTHRAVTVSVAAVAAAGLLTGCAPAAQSVLGLQANTAVLSSRPAITTEQATRVSQRALGQAQRADALRTQDAAQTAFTGLALQTAPPRYVVEKVLDPSKNTSGGALQPTIEPTRIVVTAGRTFPRTVIAVWTPDGASTQQIAVLDSPDVRSPFRVSSRVDLLPGVGLPATAPNTRGASMLPADVAGLAATPTAAVKDFAALLQTGRPQKTKFAANKVVTDVRAKAAAQAKSVKAVAVFTQTHAPQKNGMRVFRTADGGAVVVAAIDRLDRFTVRKGAGVINPPPAYRALGGGMKKITKVATVRTVQMVVFAVPPQGKGPVQLLGFTEDPVAVTGS